MTQNLLAASTLDLGNIRGNGPLGLEGQGSASGAIPLFVNVMSNVIGILTLAAILWFVVQFILGAFRWITATGDAKAVEGARMQIIHAIIGLVLVFAALVLVGVIGVIFGIDVLDMQNIITKLKP